MHIRFACVLVALAVLASSAAAQTTVTGSLGVSSSAIFRGVTDTNRPIVEGTVTLHRPWRSMELTAGAWAAAEPERYDGTGEKSLLGEHARAGLTQGALWLDASRAVGSATATLGVNTYLYPRLGGLAREYNTVELYGALAFDSRLSPTLTLYHDVGRIRGSYLEGGLEQELVSTPSGRVAIGAAAGWSLGQATSIDGPSPQTGYFGENGLTHGDLFVGVEGTTGALILDVQAHLILTSDEYTRIVGPEREKSAKLLVGVAISWTSASR